MKKLLKAFAVLGVLAVPATAMAHHVDGLSIAGKNAANTHTIIDHKLTSYGPDLYVKFKVEHSKTGETKEWIVSPDHVKKGLKGHKKLKSWLKDMAAHVIKDAGF